MNFVGEPSFEPFSGHAAFDATVALTASHLRLAAALGSPLILAWEGRVADPAEVPASCETLARCFQAAVRKSGLNEPPRISVELHPYTFALAHGAVGRLAPALLNVGTGICFDFCHFGVELDNDILDSIEGDVLSAINHVHYSDTDLVTSVLRFPPGDGAIDFDADGERPAARGLSIAYGLFGWPSPSHATASMGLEDAPS